MTPVAPSQRLRASTEKTRPSFFWLLAATAAPLVSLFAKLEIEGAEKLPREGAYVLAPNHYSEFDPLIVALAVWKMGRAPRFMAKESLFRIPGLGWILRSTGMVPVARSSSRASAKQTLETAEVLVEHGRGLIVYPEGTLTRDPDMWPMRGKTGAVRLAVEGGIPLIPMAHWGTEKIMPRYGKLSLWPLRKRVRVLVGDPIDVSGLRTGTPQPAALVDATDRLMAEVARLQSVLRGEPAPAERWNPADHAQKETGRLEP